MEIKLCVGILPYFYLMLGWINKLQTNEDWVTLLILLAFYLIVFLYKRNPSQLTFFLKSWKINNFSIIYKKEKLPKVPEKGENEMTVRVCIHDIYCNW